jgi:4-amino-4-deoxy-L-arabinose transferase-like glycosyltransferase
MPGATPRLAPWWPALLAAAGLILLGSELGRLEASAPDEPRYLEVAEELRSLAHGASDLVLLRLNHEPYGQKPPLYFWLAALAGSPGGRVSELAGRLPSALAGLLTVMLTFSLGARLLTERTGLLGAALLLTLYEFARLARRAQLDPLLTLLETLALASFWRLDRGIGRWRSNAALLHGALGLAVLTKGPVGFLVPLLVMAAYLAWEGRLRDLARALPAWGLLLSLGPGLAWIAAAIALAPTGFATEALGDNLFGRFFDGTAHARPLYYYVYQLPLDFLPWTLLWPSLALSARSVLARDAPDGDARRAWRFLLAWVGASVVFFSVSSGKRGLYLLPAFPALALLCADGARRWLARREGPPGSLAVLAGGVGLALAGLAATALALASGRPIGLSPDDVAVFDLVAVGRFGVVLGLVVVAAIGAWVVCSRRRASAPTFLAIPIASVYTALLATFSLLLPAIDAVRSVRPIAEGAAALTPAGTPIGLFEDHNLVGGIAYYADRPVRELRGAGEVAAFFANGGRVVVARAPRVKEAGLPGRAAAGFRSGERRVLLLAPP